ncbi:GAF domain-containing protein [Dyadobacter sp. CY356]|uniref:GAF domain-containing protein n=1 Tax=Dyadobacter sp. CY356 TaxID=2906442 RepID=UPI001F2DBBF9|nr:GAF domain-containing protein [Dyadobacter sp. CY356]MCF0055964.1 GAF domain-containing protein [Dyadobacter sp. CY356]
MYLAKSYTDQSSIQRKTFEIKNNDFKPATMESALSFRPFVAHLKNMLKDQPSVKSEFYRYVISKFENEMTKGSAIMIRDSASYKELMELVYMILTPLATNEREHYWALSTPIPDKIFFSTDGFYDFLTRQTSSGPDITISPVELYKKQQTQYLYRLILDRLYKIPTHAKNEVLYQYTDVTTNLPKFYSIFTDTRFIDIQPTGKLPQLDYKAMEPYLLEGADTAPLEALLPLKNFRFEGFSVITMVDVTAAQATEIIRDVLVNHEYHACRNESVIQALKTLAGNDKIDFGLIPSFQINGKFVVAKAECSQSMVVEAAKKYGMTQETFDTLVTEYFANPEMVVFNHLSDDALSEHPLLRLLIAEGISSYALIPVFYNKRMAGILEVFSKDDVLLDDAIFSRLQTALPLIAQLLKYSTEEFDAKIENIIRDKFTPLRPSVQWKFNEAAWHYLESSRGETNIADIETVTFEKVHPLYGAIDIRNSTFERNRAVKEDIKNQLNLLTNTLSSLKEIVRIETAETLVCSCDKWSSEINEYLSSADEIALNRFLIAEVNPFLNRVTIEYPATKDVVNFYFAALDETTGIAFENRRKLERSLQLVNTSVAGYIENAQKSLKSAYPFYFEKFRTDGIEYDMYIGQSMAPEKPFDEIYLKHLRLWQLTSMAEIARLTEKLLPQMEKPLRTTQMIFIHSNPININFRNDERRFDVEGAYNIRYEIIKKRIDKALVSESRERLTQPGKIALVYFNDHEADEYVEYISDLQQMGLLDDNLEYLELEELQGVIGLKALRIGVKHL